MEIRNTIGRTALDLRVDIEAYQGGFATSAEEAGAMKVVPLSVAGAFHTPIMQSAVEKLTAAFGIEPKRWQDELDRVLTTLGSK